MQYSNYISAAFSDHLTFWQEKRNLIDGVFRFPTALQVDSKEEQNDSFQFGEATVNQVEKLVNQNSEGQFVVLLSSLQITLAHLAHTMNTVVSCPPLVDHNEVKAVFFIQELHGNQSLKDLLLANQAYFQAAKKYENFPLEVLNSNAESDELTNVHFSFSKLHGDVVEWNQKHLHIHVSTDNGFSVQLSASGHFEQKQLQSLVEVWEKVILNFNNPDQKLSDISFVDPNTVHDQQDRLFRDADYPKTCVHHVLEEVCARFPDRIALRVGGLSVTYTELNTRANQFAACLEEKYEINSGDFVALCLDRSEHMVVAMLACLKLGASYVPVDPDYPKERQKFMLTDSGSKVLVVNSANDLSIDLPNCAIESTAWDSFDKENKQRLVEPEDGAYVIYTSGSTGQAKGVSISHKNLVRLLLNSEFQFDFSENDVWTIFHSFCFDFSVWEMYGALFFGGTCVLVSKEVARDTSKFAALLKQEKVTVLNQTPSAFYNLSDTVTQAGEKLESLRYVIFGGEALQPAKLGKWYEQHPDTLLINMYGITETTVHVTYKKITAREISDGKSNIGKCIPTLETWVLDPFQQIQSNGFPGELYVGGAGLAKTYLNRPEMNREKFVDHPFRAGKKLYRTGDLVKRLTSGELEYLGRIDFQVKIRGYRIELGEIEASLQRISEIKQALVLVQERNDEPFLVAYILPEAQAKLVEEKIRTQLEQALPNYMCPDYFVEVLEFPLTSNGKIDRKALPNPLDELSGNTPFVACESEQEKTMALLWEEVLDLKPIGKKHHFFKSGGHSLKVATLQSKIRKATGIEIGIGSLFAAPVLEDMAQLLSSNSDTFSSLQKIEKRDHYPLSAAQQRMFILNQFEGIGNAYNMPGGIKISGELNIERVEKSVQGLIERHAALRTSFDFIAGEPVQQVADVCATPFELTLTEQDEISELFDTFVQPFDLKQAPLFRTILIQRDAQTAYFLFDMHHIISDGVSMEILVQDFLTLYKQNQLESLNIEYVDYAVWQQENEVGKAHFKKQENYWLERFAEGIPELELPTDYTRPPIKSFAGAYHYFHLDQDTTQKLRRLTQKNGATLYMTLLGIFNVFLSKYTASSEVIVGTPVTGRPSSHLENCLGFFVNTLAIKSAIPLNESFETYLEQLSAQLTQDFAHQDYPFESLVEGLKLPRDLSRNPIFDHMFSFSEANPNTKQFDDQLEVEVLSQEAHISKFDLTCSLQANENEINGVLEYATTLYSQETINGMAEHFVMLCQLIANAFDKPISALELLTPNDQKVIKELNDTFVACDTSQTVVHLLKRQAEQQPNAIAVVYQDQKITYQEFYARVDRLAHELKELGIKKGDVVAVIATPSVEMIVSLYGIQLAQAAFLPIDPNFPSDRIDYMLEDSRATGILSYGCSYKSTLTIPQISLEKFDWEQRSNDKLLELPTGDDLAYVIYTSGSSGNPKGVKILHRTLSNVNDWNISFFDYNERSISVKYCGFSFDATVIEIFPTLTAGGTLHVIPSDIRLDLDRLAAYFVQEKLNLVFLPTKIAEALMDYDLPDMEILITGGDKLNRFVEKNYKLYNTYGPTENTVDATSYLVEKKQANIPIGKPINNVRAYIKDPNGTQQLGVGMPGELCLTGESLSIGYLHRSELTAEKFIDCPFEKGQKMYLTGDLCRMQADGNILFLGRIDQQVKVRGYRIETGEIEQQLQSLDGIKDVAVIAKTVKGETELCAFFVGVQVEVSDLKAALKKRLPDYMVPSYFVEVERIPLTPNGKKDQKFLADIPLAQILPQANYVPPTSEHEKAIAKIWQQVLALDQIGIHDNFFELGGNSLAIVKLLRALNQAYPDQFQISQLFDLAQISEQAAWLEEQEKNSDPTENTEEETRIIDF